MTYRTLTAVVITGSLIFIGTTKLFAADYAYALHEAVGRHQSNAPDAELELGIVNELADLSEAGGPTVWLPDFWAAYILTQITRSHSEDKDARLERAQAHFDRARERAAGDPAARVADLHALQGLLYSFRETNAPDEESKARLRNLERAERDKAFALDPHSPVLLVHAGTDLIAEGQKEKSWEKLMGGVALLRQAEDLFAAARLPKGLTTHYNGEWIDPWADWAYRIYEGGWDAGIGCFAALCDSDVYARSGDT